MAIGQGISRLKELRETLSGNSVASADQEMIINLRRDLNIAEYLGTQKHLEQEGVIPPNFKWPKATARSFWQAGKLNFDLRRTRPVGMVGPMKLWTSGDWWCLRFAPINRNRAAERINRKAAELSNLVHSYSACGVAESNEAWRRYENASMDQKFQTFKTLIPSLMPAKTVRKVAASRSITPSKVAKNLPKIEPPPP